MMNDIFLKELGMRIKTARMEQNFTQEKLAKLAKLKVSQIEDIENGIGNPYMKTLEMLLDMLDVPCKISLIKKRS